MLGGRIRALRLAHNLSQQELAGMAGASLSSIRRLEAGGQGTLILLARVAMALQATQGLRGLFNEPVQTIAQAEAAVQVAKRQRARKPVRMVTAGRSR